MPSAATPLRTDAPTSKAGSTGSKASAAWMAVALVLSRYGNEVVLNSTPADVMPSGAAFIATRPASTAIDVASSSNDATARAPLPPPDPSAVAMVERCSRQYGTYAPYDRIPGTRVPPSSPSFFAVRRVQKCVRGTTKRSKGNLVEGVFSRRMVGGVENFGDLGDRREDRRQDTLPKHEGRHVVDLAAAAHRDVRGRAFDLDQRGEA